MGVRAVENLRKETQCNLDDCVAVVFVASSLVPPAVAGTSPNRRQIARKYRQAAAKQFCRRLGLPAIPVFSINWGCSGYSRAMDIVHRFILPAMPLRPNQFILVVTVNRTSKIVDFGCRQTAPVFGDMAQATLLARVDSTQHPVHFALLHATAENQPADARLLRFPLARKCPRAHAGRRAALAPSPPRVFSEHDGHRRRGPAGHGRRRPPSPCRPREFRPTRSPSWCPTRRARGSCG